MEKNKLSEINKVKGFYLYRIGLLFYNIFDTAFDNKIFKYVYDERCELKLNLIKEKFFNIYLEMEKLYNMRGKFIKDVAKDSYMFGGKLIILKFKKGWFAKWGELAMQIIFSDNFKEVFNKDLTSSLYKYIQKLQKRCESKMEKIWSKNITDWSK